MRLAVLKERRPDEARVAATPETVKKYVGLGLEVAVESGAGTASGIPDADFAAAGAKICPDAASTLAGAKIVLKVAPPLGTGEGPIDELALMPRGALLIGALNAWGDPHRLATYATLGIDAASMELLPRTTRAQSMDVLSSQANLAGYRAVIESAASYGRAFPMLMTAAGTVPAAKVFVLGAGVAGLQAIATARRLGAVVTATDVRAAAKEEIKSLGANFVGAEPDADAQTAGGYAKAMTPEFLAKQAEIVGAHLAKQDIAICTALTQGRAAPRLITAKMVEGMKPGSVIVDIASDAGGNCELTKPGEEFVTPNGVKILGWRNWAARLPAASSALYAKNLLTFLSTFWDKEAKAPALKPDDDLIKGVMLTRDGAIVHPQFAPKPAQAA
jgi:NAD(P) transhydrogenase subunit alpha